MTQNSRSNREEVMREPVTAPELQGREPVADQEDIAPQTEGVALATETDMGNHPSGQQSVDAGLVRGISDEPGIRGEQYVPGAQGQLLDCTNALTATARSILLDNRLTYRLNSPYPDMEMVSEGDIKELIMQVVGTTNVKPGKLYTAIKSTVFQAPGGSGTRAAIVKKNGDMIFLSMGSNYADWYERLEKEKPAMGLIFRFDQKLQATNPHVEVDIYEHRSLPEPAVRATGDGW